MFWLVSAGWFLFWDHQAPTCVCSQLWSLFLTQQSHMVSDMCMEVDIVAKHCISIIKWGKFGFFTQLVPKTGQRVNISTSHCCIFFVNVPLAEHVPWPSPDSVGGGDMGFTC